MIHDQKTHNWKISDKNTFLFFEFLKNVPKISCMCWLPKQRLPKRRALLPSYSHSSRFKQTSRSCDMKYSGSTVVPISRLSTFAIESGTLTLKMKKKSIIIKQQYRRVCVKRGRNMYNVKKK